MDSGSPLESLTAACRLLEELQEVKYTDPVWPPELLLSSSEELL